MKKLLLLSALTIVFVNVLFSQNVPSYVPTNGLVGYWPFNGNANDESGNAKHLTNNGASLSSDRNGLPNKCYSFTGQAGNGITGTYMTFPNLLLNQIESFSINIWFYEISVLGDGESYFSFGDNGSSISISRNGYNLPPNGAGVCGFNYGSIGVNTGNGFQNQWVMCTMTMSNNILSAYINGNLIGSNNNVNQAIITSSGNYLARHTWGPDDGQTSTRFNGKLDDIAIYNRALTEQEIKALYSGSTNLASTKVFVDAPASVKQNDTLELSISTEALNTSDNVIAFQTDFSYDTTRYTYVGNNVVGTLNSNGTVDVNTSKKGLIKLGYMSQTGLNGAGSLVKLKFKANDKVGQGIFNLSNFLFNTTNITSLKSDTVNTMDVTPPSASLTFSQNPVRKGDSLLITVNFNEKMATTPMPQINLTGQNTLTNSNLTKVNDFTYTYWRVVEKGNGAVNVNLATGKDIAGNLVAATPTQNPSFTVLPTVFGDIDTNKFVQAYDGALALQYSVGLNPLPTMDALPWSNWRIAVANVDTVGNITANDASLILQKSIDKITSFPADAKKRGDAPLANITVKQEANQLVFRATGTLYAFNVFMKDNFNAFGQPEVKDKNAMIATNISSTTYNVGLASTTPFTENEPFLILPILTNENVQGTMNIVANTQEKALAYGAALSTLELNKEMLIVYPNPTKDIVTIKNAQGNTLRILNVEGKEVYNQKMTGNTLDVSLKTLGAKGMYILHIQDANNVSIQSKQIILE